MSIYSLEYLESKDIDWFFQVNGIYVHVASAGGKLPDFINNRERLREIQKHVQSLIPEISIQNLTYNDSFLDGYVEDMNQLAPNEGGIDWRREYLRSFEGFAQRGFISIDRSNLMDNDDPMYHVVCRPIQTPRLEIDIPTIEAPNALDIIMGWNSFDLFSTLGIA